MPSTSKKQHNFMAAIAHNPAFAKKVGVPQSVGKEFNKADKGKKFKEGGTMKHDDIKQDMPMMKKIAGLEATKVVNKHEKLVHKMAKGGTASSRADGCAIKGKTKGTMIKMKNGGMC
jgi:hypothetical protein